MVIVVRSKSNSTTCQAESQEFHIRHLIQSFQLLKVILCLQIDVENKYGEVKLLPKVTNRNGRAKTRTKSVRLQNRSSSLHSCHYFYSPQSYPILREEKEKPLLIMMIHSQFSVLKDTFLRFFFTCPQIISLLNNEIL